VRALSTHPRYTRDVVDERVDLRWDGLGASPTPPAFEATLRFATALVQDGMSGVTVVVPRAPGVLTRARGAAQVAGVSVHADNIGSAMITMRFSGPLPSGHAPTRPRGWARLLAWIFRARG
jgi:hypothetical protein